MSSAPKTTTYQVDGEEVVVWHHEGHDIAFSISFGGGGWMPGAYDSVEAALMGASACFTDESKFVTMIQQPINHFDKGNRLITVNDFDLMD